MIIINKVFSFLKDLWFVLRHYPLIHLNRPEPLYWFLATLVFSAAMAAIIVYFSFASEFADSIEKLGQTGDFFGGVLNPFFAAITFSALLYTIHLQHKAIDQTNAELKLALEQSTKAADAHVEAQRVMSEQLKTQALQQFDSVFFSLLDKMTDQIDKLVKGESGIEFNALYFYILTLSKDKGRNSILDNRDLSNFYIFLYQILKNIDLKLEDNKLKKIYANIVRSLIPDRLLQLLVINCYLDTNAHNFNEYKRLVEAFSLFEHIIFPTNINFCLNFLNAVAQYPDEAFGKNPDFIKFRNSVLYNGIKSNTSIHSLLFDTAKNSHMKFKYHLGEKKLFDIRGKNYSSGLYNVDGYYIEISNKENLDTLKLVLFKTQQSNGFSGIIINDSQVLEMRIIENKLVFLSQSEEFILKFSKQTDGKIVLVD